jgi:predicted Zn finger-like uncharacterized protein
MSLVTRCTSCGTLFKVVADQLKVSQGWVRCGQCGTVFDAQSNLVEPQPDTSSTASPTVSPVISSVSAPEAAVHTEPEPPSGPLSESPGESGSDSLFQPGRLRDSDILESDAGPSTATWVDSSVPQDEAQPSHAADPLPQIFAPPPTETPNFVKQAQRAQRWRSPWVRLSLSLLSLALLIGLAAQIAFHDKDRIAAQWPQALPYLNQFCQQTGCSVQPLRQIESISVDASSFNRINKNNPQLEAAAQTYRLSVSLKNAGVLPLAMPHVELSLQDAQDLVVLRRVLTPADLGISATTLAPSQDAMGSATVQISTRALGDSRIQGYRVLAFYP